MKTVEREMAHLRRVNAELLATLAPFVNEFDRFEEVHVLPDASLYTQFGTLRVTAGQMRAARVAIRKAMEDCG